MRALELAGALLGGAGEGARFVAEQLAFDELGRDGRAVQLLERRLGARRGAMDGARDELLAGAALAGDEHARVRPRSAQHALPKLRHGCALADELVEVTGARLELARLFLGAQQAERVLEHDEQAVGRQRLLEEVERAEARRPHGGVDGRVPAHHDDRDVVPPSRSCASRSSPSPSGSATSSSTRRSFSWRAAPRQTDAARDVDRVALEAERLLQRGEDRRFVVHDQDRAASHAKSLAGC